MKKKVILGAALLMAIVFVLMPFPASDLIIRIYFDDIQGDACGLYYSTNPGKGFSGEEYISCDIDHDRKMVEYRLDGSVEDKLTALRLDWPNFLEQVICVKSITVSSGGVVRKEFNPCSFFAEESIVFAHETSVTLVHPRNRAYLSCGTDDPYQILSDSVTEEIKDSFSHRSLSRLCLCLFLAASLFFAEKNLFKQ